MQILYITGQKITIEWWVYIIYNLRSKQSLCKTLEKILATKNLPLSEIFSTTVNAYNEEQIVDLNKWN